MSRYEKITTVVEFLLQIGMLELNENNCIEVYYENGEMKEVDVPTFIFYLTGDHDEYNEMCKEVLYTIANANLKKDK